MTWVLGVVWRYPSPLSPEGDCVPSCGFDVRLHVRQVSAGHRPRQTSATTVLSPHDGHVAASRCGNADVDDPTRDTRSMPSCCPSIVCGCAQLSCR